MACFPTSTPPNMPPLSAETSTLIRKELQHSLPQAISEVETPAVVGWTDAKQKDSDYRLLSQAKPGLVLATLSKSATEGEVREKARLLLLERKEDSYTRIVADRVFRSFTEVRAPSSRSAEATNKASPCPSAPHSPHPLRGGGLCMVCKAAGGGRGSR